LTPGVTLDAGGLIALDRNDRRIVVLLARARETGARVTVPATALAQAIRRPDRQVRLARLVRQPTTDVVDLGRVDATNVGRLLAASGTSDIVDAHVVICARRTGQYVVTSDPADLRLLDPAIRLTVIGASSAAAHGDGSALATTGDERNLCHYRLHDGPG
jgi:hypothetical protein